MRTTRLLPSVFAIAILVGPVQAWASSTDSTRVAPAAATDSSNVPVRKNADDRMADEVRQQVETHRAQARAFWQNGRPAQARREFLNAASLMSESGVLPRTESSAASCVAALSAAPAPRWPMPRANAVMPAASAPPPNAGASSSSRHRPKRTSTARW